MTRIATALAALALLGAAACGKAPDSTNVADTENSAGAALENSAAELEATTDTLVDNDVGNMSNEAGTVTNENAAQNATGNSAAK